MTDVPLDWIRLDALEEAIESRWAHRLIRNVAIAGALKSEYFRGMSHASEDYYFDEREEDERCIGDDCCCPHMFHSRSECFTAEMAAAHTEEI